MTRLQLCLGWLRHMESLCQAAQARRCVVLEGTEEHTANLAVSCVARLANVLWISEAALPAAPVSVTPAKPNDVQKLLGRAYDAVVLDMHRWISADVLGQVCRLGLSTLC